MSRRRRTERPTDRDGAGPQGGDGRAERRPTETQASTEFGDDHLEHSCQGGVCLAPRVGHVPLGRRPAGPPVGGARGAAPKGYRRSDARIREDVCEALTAHPDVDPSEVEVEVEDGVVTLRGVVPRRRQKRLAQDVAASCRGVEDVRNDVRVGPSRDASSAPETSAADGRRRSATR